MKKIDREKIQESYRKLYLIRRVEEEIIRFYPTDNIKSPVHLSIGQEFISVAVCNLLDDNDVVFGTYRGHALYLSKGGNLKKMIAELYGKETGCAKGKGGSMHLVDLNVGVMGTSAIVSSSISNAVGYALSMKIRKQPSVVVCFFGDGATEEGVFYESINFATLKKLPILFVCENNEYAIYTHIKDRVSQVDLCKRIEGFNIPTTKEEEGDFLKLQKTTSELIQSIKKGNGPQFLEVKCSRWKDHVGPGDDWSLNYRSIEDIKEWTDKDQVIAIGQLLDKTDREEIQKQVEVEIKEAFDYAQASLFPNINEVYTDVYCEK